MNKPSLHPDDFPPTKATLLDELLHRQLAEATGRLFFQACCPVIRALLCHCHWYFNAKTSPLTLIIICYDIESYSHIDDALAQIVDRLKRFSNNATIRIYPPNNNGVYWEFGIDEVHDSE